MGINISIMLPSTWSHGQEIIRAIGARIEPGIDHLRHLPENHLDNLSPATLFFRSSSAKKEPHIRILAGFMVPFGVNYMVEFTVNCRGIGGPWERCKSAVFWQTGQYLAVFSTRTEKEGYYGVFWECLTYQKEEKEPDLGLFSLWYCTWPAGFPLNKIIL